MPQLSTTYDSKLKKKIFVLRGNEGYATTTDVVATLITDFDDYDTHISNCHVGLEIQVLREVGEGTLLVIVNDEVITIPWNDRGMDELINTEYWNNQGIYWDNTNGKLLIGKDEGNITTGLFLLYDMDHIINVKYLGNKRCLDSSAKPIMFNIPTPTKFESTLTLHTDDARYGLSSDVDDITLLFECDNASEPKSIEIYDGETLLQTVNATKDVELTLDLSSEDLSTGSHTITALFRGDNESYRAETTLDISVGYNLGDVVYPSYVIDGLDGKVSATVKDFFGNPWEDVTVKVAKYNSGTTSWTDISSTATSGTDGKITITDVAIDSNPYAFTVGSWHGTQHTTTIINPTSISLSTDNLPITNAKVLTVTGKIFNENTPIVAEGVPITITYTDLDNTESTYYLTTNANGIYFSNNYTGSGKGLITVTSSIENTQISNTVQFKDIMYYWSATENIRVGGVQSGVQISRQSNGYKLNVGKSKGDIIFTYPNYGDEWTIEFNLMGFISGGWTAFELNSIDISDALGTMWYDGVNVKIVHSYDGTIKYYEDDELTITRYYPNQHFKIHMDDVWAVIDNLKIYRSG